MGRIRYLKPEFFFDEQLSALSPHHRLLFQGLWCLADKAGRLEDRPLMIRAQVFPYEQVDAETILADLAGHFITRYAVDEKRYIAIRAWDKHQRPHSTERESVIPAPPKRVPIPDNAGLTVNPRKSNGEVTPYKGMGMGMGMGMGRTTAPRGADAVDKSPLPATTAVDYSRVRLPFGPRKGIHIINIPADECAHLLRTMRGLGANVKAALQWRIDLKTSEMTPAQRRAHGGKQ